jgi:hypothetical protein
LDSRAQLPEQAKHQRQMRADGGVIIRAGSDTETEGPPPPYRLTAAPPPPPPPRLKEQSVLLKPKPAAGTGTAGQRHNQGEGWRYVSRDSGWEKVSEGRGILSRCANRLQTSLLSNSKCATGLISYFYRSLRSHLKLHLGVAQRARSFCHLFPNLLPGRYVPRCRPAIQLGDSFNFL